MSDSQTPVPDTPMPDTPVLETETKPKKRVASAKQLEALAAGRAINAAKRAERLLARMQTLKENETPVDPEKAPVSKKRRRRIFPEKLTPEDLSLGTHFDLKR